MMLGFMQAAQPREYESTPATRIFKQMAVMPIKKIKNRSELQEKEVRKEVVTSITKIPNKKFDVKLSQTAYVFEHMPDSFTKLQMMEWSGHSATRCTEHIRDLRAIGAIIPSPDRLLTGEVLHRVVMDRGEVAKILRSQIKIGTKKSKGNKTQTEEAFKRHIESLDLMPENFTIKDFMAIGYKSASAHSIVNNLLKIGIVEVCGMQIQARAFKKTELHK